MADPLEFWDLWLPGPGATGLSFARCRVRAQDARDRILVHAAPKTLQVTVRDAHGRLLANGENLERHQAGPMSYLVRRGTQISLEDGWPAQHDIGRLVLLPGGEAGILKRWWHADDRKEWRWEIEFWNQIRD
ncbi:MAG TPA: hypothetical protein VIN39_09805 [Candidatus Dormibacteraeota bacterium]